MFMNLGPHRNEKSKWHVPKEEWEPNKYPPFAPGMGVVLSRHVVGKMIPHFDWLKPFRLDDVYIGMLVNKANVTGMGIRKQVGAEFYDNINNRKYCAFPSTRIIAFHKVLENKCMTHLTNRSRQ
uniref:Hexosyltransferase n=1 Tax=Clytia hemisphaerica TaxID=252671 RepID=A0A7M6DQR8_9CNID